MLHSSLKYRCGRAVAKIPCCAMRLRPRRNQAGCTFCMGDLNPLTMQREYCPLTCSSVIVGTSRSGLLSDLK